VLVLAIMTVGESVVSAQSKLDPEIFKEYIDKLRDITGVSEDAALRGALDTTKESNGKFNLDKAISLLIEQQKEDRRSGDGAEETMTSTPTVAVNQSSQPNNGVVDLTQDFQAQKEIALALSMEEHNRSSTSSTSATNTRPPGVTQEDQDVSKALEASLMESNKRRRSQDIGNPEDRKRDDGWPVGLKNVGQTCWFSAVIQSFFHLPAFRILVLNFKPPQREPSDTKERKILDFMLELRKLFSLLVGSQKKYVDPSCAVDILRGCLGGGEAACNNQQDVSEFTHRLLDWLEEAFKIRDKYNRPDQVIGTNGASKEQQAMEIEVEKCDKEKVVENDIDHDEGILEDGESSTISSGNPMFDLFYGRMKIEGKNQGNTFSREEQFGQLPLQVNNFTNIHDSLEASTAHQYIDASSQSDLQNVQLALKKSGQERWITQLPPVLFFELSRFQYNQQKRMAEKVNNFLDFPRTIYMDRYMEHNQEYTRAKREQVKKLKEEKDRLNSELQNYLQYGDQSSQSIPLVTILNGTLQFARSCVPGSGGGGQVEAVPAQVKSPAPSSHSMQVDSPCCSPVSLTPASSTTNLSSSPNLLTSPAPSKLKQLPDGSLQIPIRVEGINPTNSTPDKQEQTPMEVEAEDDAGNGAVMTDVTGGSDASVGMTAGEATHMGMPHVPAPKHITELEMKVLSSCLTRWRKEIEDELALLKSALYKVENSISSMYSCPDLQLQEYHLHAVMVHEGDVNQGHYWAYVYHPEKRVWLKFNDNTVSESSEEGMKTESVGGRLNTSAYSLIYIDASRPDIIKSEDALGLKKGLPEDLEQYVCEDNKCFASEILTWKEQQLKKKQDAEMNEAGRVLIGDDPEIQIIETKNDLKSDHAVLAEDMMGKVMADMVAKCMAGQGPKNLAQVKEDVWQTVLKKCDHADCKLDNFVSYLLGVDCDNDILSRALAEHIAHPNQDLANSSFGRQWMNEAREELRQGGSVAEETIKLHRAYHNYRIAAYYFVIGVDRYNDSKLEEAVELLTMAYIVNDKLSKDKLSCKNTLGMPTRGLIKYFQIAVESLNSALVEEFQSKNNPKEVSQRVNKVLVPAIHLLQHRTNSAADPANRDAELLENVRGRWCALLESPMPEQKNQYWNAIFHKVVPDDNSVIMKQPQNLRYPTQVEDLQLANKFRNIMQTVLNEDS